MVRILLAPPVSLFSPVPSVDRGIVGAIPTNHDGCKHCRLLVKYLTWASRSTAVSSRAGALFVALLFWM